jgi:predicted SAM-dependent methyltransferase
MVATGYLPSGARRSIRTTAMELAAAAKHGIGIRAAKRYSGKRNLKLNIGCGGNTKADWINIDLSSAAELMLDGRERFPFDDNSCDAIYSEHFLEHLDYPGDAIRFLRESFRVLAPGGSFSVGVPDTRWALLAYVDETNGYLESPGAAHHPHWCVTPLDHINFHFRQDGEHRYAYDFETLRGVLEKAGFVDAREREFNPDLDSEWRRIGTLYIDAVKPHLTGAAP